MIDNMNIRAGSLHDRAELQGQVTVIDAGGGRDVSFVKERDLWCHIRDVSGKMAQESMQREEQIRVEIFARFNSDITTKKRIVHDGKNYMIEAVLRKGLRKELVQIIALEGVPT
jgi:SPP1 family predicted phage head-tail adaptor